MKGVDAYLDENLNPVFCLRDDMPHEVDQFLAKSLSFDERQGITRMREETPVRFTVRRYLKAYTPYKKDVVEIERDEDGTPTKAVIRQEEGTPSTLPLYITRTVLSLGRDPAINDRAVQRARNQRSTLGNEDGDEPRKYYDRKTGRYVRLGDDVEDDLRFSMNHEISDGWLRFVGDSSIEL